jgi:hypothetical protein
MICRVWRGIAPAEKAEEQISALAGVAGERCLAIPGVDGVVALKRCERGLCEILFVSLWSSMKALNSAEEHDAKGLAPGVEEPEAVIKANRSVDFYDVIFAADRDRERKDGFFNEISPIGVLW